MTKRILDIVDMQNDFMKPNGALYVQDAEKVIPRANAFLQDIKAGDFDFALVKFDTHFEETYAKNPESELFPPHCMFDTWGWKLAIDMPQDLDQKTALYTMTKNVFNMWAAAPEIKDIDFKNDFNEQAYRALFTVDENTRRFDRDDFMTRANVGRDTEVVMMGVASDYCVHDAMLGYLERGAKVVVLSDLVKGIGTDVPGRAPSGEIEDVAQLPAFKKYTDSGQLKIMTSDEYKKILRKGNDNDKANIKKRGFKI